MKHLFLLFSIFLFSSSVAAQIRPSIAEKEPFAIGEIIEVFSKNLNENRVINIYLPQNYQVDRTKQYPVIYLLDGGANEDFIHIAGLVQFGSFSWINMIPETIVVGIANVDRQRDFTYPTNEARANQEMPSNGGSAKFIDFIEKELRPMIDKEYRTNSTNTIIGQSLGGLLATEILFKKPGLFDHYIMVSPSLWWDGESLLKNAPKKITGVQSIYVGVGKEGEVMESVAQKLHEKLKSIIKKDTLTFFNFFEKQNHGDALHLAVYDTFEKKFKPKEK